MDVSGTVVAVSSLLVVAGDSTVVVGKSMVVVACFGVEGKVLPLPIKVVVLLVVPGVVGVMIKFVKKKLAQPLSLFRQSYEG